MSLFTFVVFLMWITLQRAFISFNPLSGGQPHAKCVATMQLWGPIHLNGLRSVDSNTHWVQDPEGNRNNPAYP